jgi:hypothetical protein
MIVTKIAFGNEQEAYIENRLKNTVNIIFSDDNNKGKTLLIQSMMYSIGNSPIFPSTFDDYNCYFYSKIRIKRKYIEFLRKGNTILVKIGDDIQIFDSISDFKYYFDKSIFSLPRYISDSGMVVSDLSLFYQMFYLSQDKRNTSNVINGGFFNKNDFMLMIRSLIAKGESVDKTDEIKELRDKIKQKEKDIAVLQKRNSFSKRFPDIAGRVLKNVGVVEYQKLESEIRELNAQIVSVSNKRNRETNRKIKLEGLIEELNSLNRKIEVGRIICGECGSDKIIYTNGDISFKITNDIVRKQILESIINQIDIRNEIINYLNEELLSLQSQMSGKIKEIPVEVGDLIISKDDILNEEQNDIKISSIKMEIEDLKSTLKAIDEEMERSNAEIDGVIDRILNRIQTIYSSIDQSSRIHIESLFSKHDQTFSGSEEQIFYYSKLISINEILKIPFPIIIDCFRDGEISSEKERKMIDGFIGLRKQVILTSTLKEQEYDSKHYSGINRVNAIDYSEKETNHILNKAYCKQFCEILKTFRIDM